MVYSLFKFLHIIGAIIWIGGVISVGVIIARIAREKDGAMLATMSRQSRFYGAAIIGPAAGVTLLAGIVMIVVAGLGIPLWVIWGFGAIIISMALGATLLRRAADELSNLVTTATPGDPRVVAAQRQLLTLYSINALVLLSAVAAMVFKPAL